MRFCVCSRGNSRLADLAVAMLASGGQFIFGGSNRLPAVGALTVEVGDNTRQLPHRARDGDAEHTLAALQEVDDLLGRRALVHGVPSENKVMLARSWTPRWRRWSTATRMLCSEIPVSSNRLTILRTKMSLNEYSRWLPDPAALRIDGTTNDVRAQ